MKVTLLLIGTLCVLSGTAEDFDIICTSNPVMEARMVSVEQNLGKLEGIEELLKQLVVADKNKELDEMMDELKHSTKTVQEMVKESDEKQNILEGIVVENNQLLKQLVVAVQRMVKELDEKQDTLDNIDVKMDEIKNTTQTVQGLDEKQNSTTSTPMFVVRLPGTPNSGWGVRSGRVDAIEFTSSKDIHIHGISMFGSYNGSSTLTGLMEMKEGGSVLTSQNFQYTSDDGQGYYDQMFAKQGYARAGVKYTLTVEYSTTAWITTPTIWAKNSGGLASITNICKGATITFKFTDSSDSTNGSGVSRGQIPRIIFAC